MNAIGTAFSGLQVSMARLDASASRVASASLASATDPQTTTAAPANVDLASEMIEQLQTKLSFEANASVIQRASDMEKSVLELWA